MVWGDEREYMCGGCRGERVLIPYQYTSPIVRDQETVYNRKFKNLIYLEEIISTIII